MANGDPRSLNRQKVAPVLAGCKNADAATEASVDALAVERRRQIVQRTVDADGPIEFDGLVEDLVGSARNSTSRATDPDRVALRLYHVDLPKLAEADLVDYDREEKIVEATEAASELGAVLDDVDE